MNQNQAPDKPDFYAILPHNLGHWETIDVFVGVFGKQVFLTGVSASPPTENAVYMESTNSPDFQHGYDSGVAGVDQGTYEGYLSSQTHADWLTDCIADKRARLQQLDRQLTSTTEANGEAFALLQPYALRVERLARQVAQFETNRQATEAERDALRQRRATTRSDYSLLAGLFFLVAGLSFLAGDLIISHEIVAYALNIRNSTEAWAFAVGLAMVSILLKPAYDRLIETPYQENPVQNRGRYERFKITLAVFAVLTLAVLGWFRYEAYRTDQLKSAINKSIRQVQLSADPLSDTPTLDATAMAKIERQLVESSELNLALVNSPWALLSFVLSGVLFALAGAVCLGIALPVLTVFWYRWLQIDVKLGKLSRRLKRVSKALNPLETELAEQRIHQSIAQHAFDLLPSLEELRQQRQRTLTDLSDLSEELKLALTDSRISQFTDGYEQGRATRTALSDDEQRQLHRRKLNGNLPAESATATAIHTPIPS